MGYLKYKFDNAVGFNLISTEDVVRVEDNTPAVQITYGAGYVVEIENQAGAGLGQDDVNTVINGINIINGSSGTTLDIEFSQLADYVGVTKL
jgi:hypothetical protein